MSGTTYNEKIAFTANVVAYRRSFTDIPYAKAMHNICERVCGPLEKHHIEWMKKYVRRTPVLEARYLMTDLLLAETGIKQILELASGFSPRGFAMCADPSVTYVEVDLSDQNAFKERIVKELHRELGTDYFPNLHFVDGALPNRDVMAFARTYLKRTEPICVICEGLLRYLNWNDKTLLAERILNMLDNDSVWITPDFETIERIRRNPAEVQRYNQIAATRGYDVRPNLFINQAHMLSFFEEIGFAVEAHPWTAVFPKLVSPERLELDRSKVLSDLADYRTLVLRRRAEYSI